MKIRDLQQYIKDYIKGDIPKQLGTKDDEFYTRLYGEYSDIKSKIGNIASFAKNRHIQIFYEFLQNADDSEASNFHVFFDKNNLLIINNGNPFYTDFNDENKGQLSKFLTVGKSDKAQDPSKKGKYGQGSKLLYDFFLDRDVEDASEEGKIEKRRQKVLVNKLQAPILFSWENPTSITDLINFDTNKDIFNTKSYDDIECSLLTRIIYTYYPAMPNEIKQGINGQEVELFSDTELNNFITFFKKVSSELDIATFTKGTALFIRLGNGQYDKLQETANNQKFLHDIEVSLFLLDYVKRIQIQDSSPINRDNLENNFIIEPLNDKENKIPFTLIYPKEPQKYDSSEVSNFFQYFPILSETHKFKFIIHSNIYDITQDRQNIDIENGGSNDAKRLKIIAESLKSYVKGLRSQKDKFISFFLCFILSEESHVVFYNETFLDSLQDAFSENIPTQTDFKDSTEYVKIKDTSLGVNPQDLGLADYDWLHPSLEDYQDKVQDIFDEIETWNIIDLLNEAKAENIVQWIKKRSKRDYQTLLDELVGNTSKTSDIADIPFIKFDNGEFYSLEEVLTKDNPYFLITDKTKGIKEILQRCGAVISEGIIDTSNPLFTKMIQVFDNDVLLFDKINTFLTIHRGKFNHHDKWNIFRNFHDQFNINILAIKNKITKELIIFQNQKDEYKVLCELHPHANDLAPSGILNHYQMKYSEKEFDDFSQIYQYTLKGKPDSLWGLFQSNWEKVHLPYIENEVKKNEDLIKLVYQDLKSLHQQTGKVRSVLTALSFAYTTKGEFVRPEQVLYYQNLINFSENDYNSLIAFLEENTDYEFIPYEHLQVFEKYISEYANATSYNEITNHFTQEEFTTIEKNELLLLQKLKASNEQFFAYFVIIEEENKLQIKIKTDKEYQYFLEDSYRELNQFLYDKPYYLLPSNLQEYFENDSSLQKESDDFASKLIDEYENEPALMELVYHTIPNVKRKYINKVLENGFELHSEGEKYDKKSFEARFIEIGVNLEMIENIKDNTSIDQKPLRQFEWSDNVSFRVDDETYVTFSLEELLPEKASGSKILDKVKGLFPHDVPSNKIFTQKPAPLKDIKADLFNSVQDLFDNSQETIKRVTFLVAYYLSEESKQDTKPSIPKLQFKAELLEEFFQQRQKGLKKYHEYYQFDDFTPKNCLQSPDPSLLLEEEKLPIWVQNWLNTHKDKKKAQIFLEAIGVNSKSHSAIEVRDALKNNKDTKFVDALVNYQGFCENTFEWFAQTKNTTLRKNETNYKILSDLVKKYSTKYGKLPDYMLYLQDESAYTYVKRQTQNTLYFDRDREVKRLILAKNKYSKNLIDARHTNEDFKIILKNNSIYPVYVKGDIVEEKTKNAQEWTVPYYKEWKKDAKVKYSIKIAQEPFPFKYLLNYNQESQLIEENLDGEIAITEHKGFKTIYIYPEGKSFEEKQILKILQAHDENEEEEEDREQFFKSSIEKDLFAKLFSLALPKEEDSRLLSIIKEENFQDADFQAFKAIKDAGFSNSTQIQELIQNQGKNQLELENELSSSQKQVLQKNINEILKITEQFSQEDLKHIIEKQAELKEIIKLPKEDFEKIAEHLPELVKFVQKFNGKEIKQLLEYADILKNLLEQEKEAKINSITGFIGEMITYYHLVSIVGEDNIKHVSQVDNKAEYDFEITHQNKRYEIDTKTTVKSLYEENNAIPLYVKLSQYHYVKNNKVDNYLIDRISLKDMGDSILAIKNKYQGMKKPLEEVKEELKEEIEIYMKNKDNRAKYKKASFMFRINYENFFEVKK